MFTAGSIGGVGWVPTIGDTTPGGRTDTGSKGCGGTCGGACSVGGCVGYLIWGSPSKDSPWEGISSGNPSSSPLTVTLRGSFAGGLMGRSDVR